jgi:adenylate cyclase
MRRLLIGLALGAVAGALALLLAALPVVRELEDSTYDWRLNRTARQTDARQDIALVLINESSVRALEPLFGRWPWPRVVHSGVIDFLARAQARVVAYDVLFVDRDRTSFQIGGRAMTGAESDAALAASVARAGNVVLLADAVYEGTVQGGAEEAGKPALARLKQIYRPGAGFQQRPTLLLPYDELADAALAFGHNFGVKGSDSIARSFRPFIEWQGVAIPSLGMAAAAAAERIDPNSVRLSGTTLSVGARRMPLEQSAEIAAPSLEALLNFRGPFESTDGGYTYPTYPFFNVLLSEEQMQRGETPAIPLEAFKGKVVFIGTSADGMSDIWRSPFGGGGMPGVQLHAAMADDLLSSRFMRRASRSTNVALTMAVGAIAAIAATLLPVIWGVPLAIAMAVAIGAGATYAVGAGVWIAAVPPMAAIALALFEGVAWQYFVEGREKRRVKGLFGRYVSTDVFNHLMADPSVARLGGDRREMTVLFSDIRGFTTATENSTPEAVVCQLNEYFTAMVEVLFRHQGTLDKFVGDMVMGLFGAPVTDPRHADHAVAAALEMADVLDRLNARWAAEGRPAMEIGIGINSGEMIAGNIGSNTIMSYTVIGDAVNLGARLESLNKEYGTRILISEETRARLTSAVPTRLIGNVTVKGKTRPVTVYEVIVMGTAS